MKPLHPLIEKAIRASTEARGALVELSADEVWEAKMANSAAHGHLGNACDSFYGTGLNYTTYVGIHPDGRPWAVALANDVSGKRIHPLGITVPPAQRGRKMVGT